MCIYIYVYISGWHESFGGYKSIHNYMLWWIYTSIQYMQIDLHLLFSLLLDLFRCLVFLPNLTNLSWIKKITKDRNEFIHFPITIKSPPPPFIFFAATSLWIIFILSHVLLIKLLRMRYDFGRQLFLWLTRIPMRQKRDWVSFFQHYSL